MTMSFDKEQSMGQLNRITQQPGVMGGKACIRGMRVTVGMVVGQIGAGHSVDEILADYPYLEREDIMQALRYAAARPEIKRRKIEGSGIGTAGACLTNSFESKLGEFVKALVVPGPNGLVSSKLTVWPG